MATKKLILWDSDIFITWMNPVQELGKSGKCNQSHIDAINQMADLVESKEIIIVATSLTRVEVLAARVPTEAKDKFDKLWRSDTFEIVSPDERVIEKAHEIRNYYWQRPELPTPKIFDAIHLATAVHFGCEFLFTFDGSGKKPGLIALSGRVADQWPIIIRTPDINCLGFPPKHKGLFDAQPAGGDIGAT